MKLRTAVKQICSWVWSWIKRHKALSIILGICVIVDLTGVIADIVPYLTFWVFAIWLVTKAFRKFQIWFFEPFFRDRKKPKN